MVEKMLAAHQQTRTAEATLHGIVGYKGLLDRMQLSVCGDAFDGCDFLPNGIQRQSHARIDRSPLHDDRAGTAGATVTAYFGAGEVEPVSKHLRKGQPGFNGNGISFAVNG